MYILQNNVLAELTDIAFKMMVVQYDVSLEGVCQISDLPAIRMSPYHYIQKGPP